MKLSIIVPVYNEEKTIIKILDKLVKTKLGVKKEIIIIDDGSKDESKKLIEKYLETKKPKKNLEFKFLSKKNEGKGSVVRKGIKLATGNIITIQDADLEYNPEDYKALMKPILKGKEKVVYGSRFLKQNQVKYYRYYFGNKFLSLLTKLLYRVEITDMETCYKVFDAKTIKNIPLKGNHFEIEPEITAKLLKKGINIKELPIDYSPRTIHEGKKINWKDGLQAIWILIYLRFFG